MFLLFSLVSLFEKKYIVLKTFKKNKMYVTVLYDDKAPWEFKVPFTLFSSLLTFAQHSFLPKFNGCWSVDEWKFSNQHISPRFFQQAFQHIQKRLRFVQTVSVFGSITVYQIFTLCSHYTFSCRHENLKCIRYSMNTYPNMWLSLQFRDRRGPASLSYRIAPSSEALPGMIFVPAQNLSGI